MASLRSGWGLLAGLVASAVGMGAIATLPAAAGTYGRLSRPGFEGVSPIARRFYRKFAVFVGGRDGATLCRVRLVVPRAFLGAVDGQPAIVAAIVDDRQVASEVQDALVRVGLAARQSFAGAVFVPDDIEVVPTGELPNIVQIERRVTPGDMRDRCR